jgi:hypothetical protein
MTSDASPITPSSEETASIIRQIWDAAADNDDSLWGSAWTGCGQERRVSGTTPPRLTSACRSARPQPRPRQQPVATGRASGRHGRRALLDRSGRAISNARRPEGDPQASQLVSRPRYPTRRLTDPAAPSISGCHTHPAASADRREMNVSPRSLTLVALKRLGRQLGSQALLYDIGKGHVPLWEWPVAWVPWPDVGLNDLPDAGTRDHAPPRPFPGSCGRLPPSPICTPWRFWRPLPPQRRHWRREYVKNDPRCRPVPRQAGQPRNGCTRSDIK